MWYLLLGTKQHKSSIEQFLINQLKRYGSNWFEKQYVYVECWLEKRALERIFLPITDEYGVYLSVSGKHPSLAQVHSGKERFFEQGKEKFIILYFGDLDPVGKSMCRYLRKAFPELKCPNVSIEEIAINVNQVTQYSLPTIKLKKHTTNEWFKENYDVDYGVEIDALPPNILKQMIRDSIEKYLDTTEIDKKRDNDSMDIKRMKERLRKIKEDS